MKITDRPEREQTQRDQVAGALRGLRAHGRTFGPDPVTQALVIVWGRQARLLQGFRRSDASRTCLAL